MVSDTDTYYTNFGETNTQQAYGVFLAYFSGPQAAKNRGLGLYQGILQYLLRKAFNDRS
jgi:hypothetical protein